MELVDGVHEQVNGMMKGVMGELENMQPSPLGTTLRSEKERKNLWNKLAALQPEERQRVMGILAKISKHSGPDLDDCELCGFIKDMAKQSK